MRITGQQKAMTYLHRGLKQKRLSPSLLFVGLEGVGKRTVSLELAKSLLCLDPREGEEGNRLINCDACRACVKVAQSLHPDLVVVNADLQASLLDEKPGTQTSVKIEAVRHLSKFLYYKPMEGSRRVAIIEEAQTLTNEAANALLKILEEPPQTGLIVLLATDSRNLPSTILSRCALVRFEPVPASVIQTWLETDRGLAPERALAFSKAAGGSFAQALSVIEDEGENFDLADFSLEEFFDSVGRADFRSEGRAKAEKIITHLLGKYSDQLEQGDVAQAEPVKILLSARQQLERFVPARLVLENLFLSLQPYQQVKNP